MGGAASAAVVFGRAKGPPSPPFPSVLVSVALGVALAPALALGLALSLALGLAPTLSPGKERRRPWGGHGATAPR